MSRKNVPVPDSATRFLAIACIAGYWVVAHGIGDFYPISPLGMFRERMTSAHRLVVRPVSGEASEIGHYVDWHCERPLDFSNAAHPDCPPTPFSAYDDIVSDYIRSHQGEPALGAPVEIVRRKFTINKRFGAVHVNDCRLLSCTARHVGPSRWMPRL